MISTRMEKILKGIGTGVGVGFVVALVAIVIVILAAFFVMAVKFLAGQFA